MRRFIVLSHSRLALLAVTALFRLWRALRHCAREHLGGAVDDDGLPPLSPQGECVVAGAAADVGKAPPGCALEGLA
jgi:hypothetical protein